MGFLNEMASEFGKKTGKALGNKLYGKHADDVRIGVRNMNDGSSNQVAVEAADRKAAAEAAERAAEYTAKAAEYDYLLTLEKLEKNEKATLRNEIQNISFPSDDFEACLQSLQNLYYFTQMNIKDADSTTKEIIKAAQSKFKSGLVICQGINPKHPLIEMYQQEIEDVTCELFDVQDLNELKDAQLKELKKAVQSIKFSDTDFDYNTKYLDMIAHFTEEDPDTYDDDIAIILRLIITKYNTGLAICKKIDSSNIYFTLLEQEQKAKQEAKAKREAEEKKNSRNFGIFLIIFVIIIIIYSLLAK